MLVTCLNNNETYVVNIYEFANTIDKLLETKTVEFNFYRVTYGSSRNAVGTRNLKLIPSSGHPSGKGAPKIKGLIRYWDIRPRMGQWRSFYIWNVNSFKVID